MIHATAARGKAFRRHKPGTRAGPIWIHTLDAYGHPVDFAQDILNVFVAAQIFQGRTYRRKPKRSHVTVCFLLMRLQTHSQYSRNTNKGINQSYGDAFA
jgi:hypothetical protein